MRLAKPLIPARLVRRYKRFLADVRLEDGDTVTAHCPNPGRMTGLDGPGSRVWLSRSDRPTRKLPLTLELVEADGTLVGVNTTAPNAIAAEAIADGRIPELSGYAQVRREVRYGNGSRVDLLLTGPDRADAYVEIKNVHWRVGSRALFPDAVTARGTKHLRELERRVQAGDRAGVLYVVQRSDCETFGVAEEIDPLYAATFREVLRSGVEAWCYGCKIDLEEILLDISLPLVI